MLYSEYHIIITQSFPPFPSLLKMTYAKQDFVGNSKTTMG